MRDLLGWSCEEGCNCKEQGHIHHDDPNFIARHEEVSWWRSIFGK